MNPVRTGRAVLLFLPYLMIVSGCLAAGKAAGAPGGTAVAVQALIVAAVGGAWACIRARRSPR